MDVLIRDSLIIQKVITDDNKHRYKFSEEIEKNTIDSFPYSQIA